MITMERLMGAQQRCPRCTEHLPLEAFPERYRGKPGNYCTACSRAYKAAYRAAHRKPVVPRPVATLPPLVNRPAKARAITTYDGVHGALIRLYGRAGDHPCTSCAGPAHDWAYDHSDPHQRLSANANGYLRPYSLDLRKYRPMCRSCHGIADKGRPEVVARRADPKPNILAWW